MIEEKRRNTRSDLSYNRIAGAGEARRSSRYESDAKSNYAN